MNHLQTLRDFNAWRRSDDAIEQPDPKTIGEAIDWAIRVCEAAQNLKRVQNRDDLELAEDKLFDALK
jgi:hypothetical protein